MQHGDPIGAIVQVLSTDYTAHERKRSTRFLVRFQRYTQWLQNISSVVDIAVQSQAGILCPLWAPVKYILQVSPIAKVRSHPFECES